MYVLIEVYISGRPWPTAITSYLQLSIMRPLRMLASIFINQSENTKVTHSHNNYAISEKSYDRIYCEILPINVKFGMIYLFGGCNITKLRNIYQCDLSKVLKHSVRFDRLIKKYEGDPRSNVNYGVTY